MKKKMLPVLLLLAGLSATALASCGGAHEHTYGSWTGNDELHWQECECGEKTGEGVHIDVDENGKCDICDRDVHVHEYTWESDANSHWKECDCGNKKDQGAHVDVKNNETDAEQPDDKCDVCGREATVKFDMKGHGVAPEKQYVALGGKATAPRTPADDDCWKFKGWYKDADCTQAFNFETDTIDAVTTIYAKWEEDTTEGASKAHAFELTKSVANTKAVEKDKTVYFKFTAETEGRYTVEQAAGTYSQNSTFTTSLTGDTVYGKDQDAAEVTFDMNAGQTVYVMFTYLGENGTDVTAGVLLDETLDEPLPEGYFLKGKYTNGSVTVMIDRDEKEVTYGSFPATPFKYIGGKFDRVYFNIYMESIGDTITYTLRHNSDGTYTLLDSMSGGNGSTLNYVLPQPPIALSEIEGYYEPEETATYSITKLYIYASESTNSTIVRYEQSGSFNNREATYDTETNELLFNGYMTITLNLAEDNSVESISFNGNVYLRKGAAGDVVPENLPLHESKEYVGESFVFRTNAYGGCYFGATGYNTVSVTDYAKATDTYTVSVSVSGVSTIYKVKISEDKNTITLYDEAGTTPVDTLTLFEYVYHDFPTNGGEVSIAANDFQKGLVYLFKATEEKWYTFTDIPNGVSIYYGLNSDDPLSYAYEGTLVGEEAVRLPANCIIGVFMETPAAISFTVTPAQAPVGWAEDKPMVVNNGTATIENIAIGATYYFTYTASENGGFAFNVFYDDGNSNNSDFNITYTLDGTEHIFGSLATNAITGVVVTAGQVVKINVYNVPMNREGSSVTVAVVEDVTVGATELKLTGTPSGDTLEVSATAATGANYLIADTKGASVTVTGTAMFKIKLQSGKEIESTTDTFTVEIPTGTDVYFRITADTQQTLTFSQSFTKGSEGYPLTVSAETGNNTLTVNAEETTFFTLPAGNYIFSASNANMAIRRGNNAIDLDKVVEVAEGEVFFFDNRYSYEDASTLTVTAATEIFTADQAGTYKSADGKITLVLTKFNYATYTVNQSPNPAVGGAVVITKGTDGKFTFTYSYIDPDDWSDDPVMITKTVTFSFTDGKISLSDSGVNNGTAIELEKEVVVEAVTYTGTISGGGTTYDVKVEINGSTVTYWIDTGDGLSIAAPKADLTDNGDGSYTFKDSYGDSHSFTMATDGSTITFTDGYYNATGTLTKQA